MSVYLATPSLQWIESNILSIIGNFELWSNKLLIALKWDESDWTQISQVLTYVQYECTRGVLSTTSCLGENTFNMLYRTWSLGFCFLAEYNTIHRTVGNYQNLYYDWAAYLKQRCCSSFWRHLTAWYADLHTRMNSSIVTEPKFMLVRKQHRCLLVDNVHYVMWYSWHREQIIINVWIAWVFPR